MKGFYIEIKNDLLDAKHQIQMGKSVWLFMWLLDKMTSINEEGVGKVLGGRPILYEEIKNELGISRRTYAYWISRLRTWNYISTIQAPYGLCISVNKASKIFGKKSNLLRRKGESLTDFMERRSASLSKRGAKACV